MKIPKQIKIGGHIFKVIIEDRDNVGADGKLGSCKASINKIWLDIKQPQTQMESTLLHEIIEALNWQMNIGISEEKICQLEAGLYQTLKDNDLLK